MASIGQVGIGHPHIDARSLDMARIVVERIDADPGLFNVALENLERWRRLHGTLSRANEEWKQILERPWREILLDESDACGTGTLLMAALRTIKDRMREKTELSDDEAELTRLPQLDPDFN